MLLVRLQEWITRFIAIIITALPLMVLGVLAYAIIEHFVSRERVLRLIPRQQWLAVPVAALLGIVLPVCDCGVVPTTRAFIRRELGLAPALAFLIGAPVINPIVLFATAAGFGFNYTIAIARLALTFVVAIGVGWLGMVAFGEVAMRDLTVRFTAKAESVTLRRPLRRAPRSKKRKVYPLPAPLQTAAAIAAEAGEQMLDLGRFLILGALVAAAVQTFIPQTPLLSVSQGVITSTLSLMALASILSICSVSDAPIAYSFLGTFAPGAVFAFMLFGQIFDLKNAAMLLATFRRPVVIFYVGASALLVLALGTLVNLGVF